MKANQEEITEQIESMLRAQNGRRRQRILTKRDVRNVLRDIIEHGDRWSGRGGGTVANAYKYRAYQTVIFAYRAKNGNICLSAALANAHKGSSLVTPFGPRSCRDKDVLAWIESNSDIPSIVLDEFEARRYLTDLRITTRVEYLNQTAERHITVLDSE